MRINGNNFDWFLWKTIAFLDLLLFSLISSVLWRWDVDVFFYFFPLLPFPVCTFLQFFPFSLQVFFLLVYQWTRLKFFSFLFTQWMRLEIALLYLVKMKTDLHIIFFLNRINSTTYIWVQLHKMRLTYNLLLDSYRHDDGFLRMRVWTGKLKLRSPRHNITPKNVLKYKKTD